MKGRKKSEEMGRNRVRWVNDRTPRKPDLQNSLHQVYFKGGARPKKAS